MDNGAAVAIIGMAGRFPGAPDLDSYWELLLEGRAGGRRATPEDLQAVGLPARLLDDPGYVPIKGALEGWDTFDADFFGMPPGEAHDTDPQHRVFLECCQHAVEDSGVVPARFPGTIGVYAGCSANTWAFALARARPELLADPGALASAIPHDKDHLTSRVAWKLGLTGPAITVQAACATSLAAVALASQALLSYQCDLALAGGASVSVGYGHRPAPGDILSPDGLCRAYDAQAAGTFVGDGVGVVVLRRLDDALAAGDPIRAVILGSGLSNDGPRRIGYTAPGVEGQVEAIAAALALAGVAPESVGLIEGHGTGTALGDPVEVEALRRAYAGAPPGSVALGSVKSNVGHLNAAAGVAGLIKAVLALEHAQIPPTLRVSQPNPVIPWASTPFVVPTAPRPFPGHPRRAAVSSLGAGGTNVHVVLEAAPPRTPSAAAAPALLLLSGRSEAASVAAAERLADWIRRHPEAAAVDVAATLREGRAHRPFRRAGWLSSKMDWIGASGHAPQDRPVGFLFPAQGGQHVDLARSLYEGDPTFRQALARRAARVAPDLLAALYPADDAARPAAEAALDDQRLAGAAIFAVGLTLAERALALGVQPVATLGHSTGEYLAAVISGVLTEDEAAHLFMARARLFATLPRGAVLQVALPADALHPTLPPQTWIALHNAPSLSVVTGTPDAVAILEARLAEAGVSSRRLRVSVPAHSPLLAPIAEALRAEARQLSPRPPEIPMICGATGTWVSAEAARSPDYWVAHLLEPVRLPDAVATLRTRAGLGLELGPRGSLAGLAQLCAPDWPVVSALAPMDGAPPQAWPAALAGALWCWGAPLPPGALGQGGQRIHLPGTVFQRVRFGLEGEPVAPAAGPRRARHPRPARLPPAAPPRTPAEALVVSVYEEVLDMAPLGVEDDVFALGGDSLATLKLVAALQRRSGQTLPPGAAFSARTPAALARHLVGLDDVKSSVSQDVTPGDEEVLVPLQTQGTLPPLYFAHPAAGVAFPYVPLARALGEDQPFYALQAVGLDGRQPPDRTVAEMAARYIRVIRRVQPSGPLRLGGFSFGCYIAFEMARQLTAAGEEVALLALVDEPAPIDGNRPRPAHLVRLTVGRSGRAFARHLHDWLYLSARGRGAGVDALLQRSAMAALLPPEAQEHLGHSAMGPMYTLFKIHLAETWAYAPPPWEGRAVLFKSDWWYDRPFFDRGHRQEDLGWSALVRGGLEVRRGSGDHLAMIRQPHVERLAAGLREVLSDVNQRYTLESGRGISKEGA